MLAGKNSRFSSMILCLFTFFASNEIVILNRLRPNIFVQFSNCSDKSDPNEKKRITSVTP